MSHFNLGLSKRHPINFSKINFGRLLGKLGQLGVSWNSLREVFVGSLINFCRSKVARKAQNVSVKNKFVQCTSMRYPDKRSKCPYPSTILIFHPHSAYTQNIRNQNRNCIYINQSFCYTKHTCTSRKYSRVVTG